MKSPTRPSGTKQSSCDSGLSAFGTPRRRPASRTSVFVRSPRGKTSRLERRLGQPEEEIALILVVVATPQQAELAVRGAREAGVVPGRDVGGVEAARDLREIGELHCAVAAHAGDGGPPRSVFRDEGVDHVRAERLTLVEHVVRDAEVLAGASGIVTVFGRAAAARPGARRPRPRDEA